MNREEADAMARKLLATDGQHNAHILVDGGSVLAETTPESRAFYEQYFLKYEERTMEKLELSDYLERIARALEEQNEINREWTNWNKQRHEEDRIQALEQQKQILARSAEWLKEQAQSGGTHV